jgi:peptide/bleomycin uptake transporter
MRFARLMEGLGVSFMRSVMTLFAFLPILWTLYSAHARTRKSLGEMMRKLSVTLSQ